MGTVFATHSFNLLENPFVLLNISPTASNAAIVEAFEDAIADESSPEPVLNTAKQSLLDPKFRIHAELSFLLDTPFEKASAAIAMLRRRDQAADKSRVMPNLGPLSRLNLLMPRRVNGDP